MPVTPSYQRLVVEQLSRVVHGVRARRMFGGAGIYAGEAFFALIADDTLYFKVDAATRPGYEARGMEAFRPFGEGGATMQYFQVPEEVFEDPDELRAWAEGAIAVARRGRRTAARRSRG